MQDKPVFQSQIDSTDGDAVGPDLLFSASEIYHENSKLRPSDKHLALWINYINNAPHIRQIISRPLTHYRGHPSVSLPRQFAPSPMPFEEIVTGRRSAHQFSGDPLSLESLAKILFLGDGVTSQVDASDGTRWSLRAAPSGGGLYPIEMYCVAINVDGLSPGLYAYNPPQHALEYLRPGELGGVIAEATFLKEEMAQASACIILSAAFGRAKFKYGERAYRFALLEAGHIAQNLLLAAWATGCGGLPVGGFTDDLINQMLRVDGVREAALYMVVLGGAFIRRGAAGGMSN